MRLLLFIIITFSSCCAYSQEFVEPISFNNKIHFHSNKNLSLRSDTDNYKITIFPTRLPFLDDFSTDKRFRMTKVEDYVSNIYYAIGKCSTISKYHFNTYHFNKDSAFSYTWNTTTNSVDSNYLNPIVINIYDDTLDCENPTNSLTMYPSYYRVFFDPSNGNRIDSTLIYDTTFYSAKIKYVFIKKGILWLDEYAYVNTTYGYMPPSKGVATLDGLNQYGKAYDKSIVNNYGAADYLTSNKIDLNGRRKSDSTFLSFMLQPQGFGDWPDVKDSIVVQFRGKDGVWNSVYKVEGLTERQALDSNLRFKHHLIYIPGQDVSSDPEYYYSEFQFRFKNYATISGNNDHWNIDYVRIDTARNSFDTTFKDATFVYDLPTFLKNYTLLPAKQYISSNDLVDTINAYNKNFLAAPILSTYNISCVEDKTGNVIYETATGVPYSANPLSIIQYKPNEVFLFNSPIQDSTYVTSKVFVDASDFIVTNDTASHRQFFFNEMAYDDGSAEMAYGIQGSGIKKVAYKFYIPKKDTLAAIKFLFTTIDMDVSKLVFNINIWKSIGMDGNNEVILKTISNKKPTYLDSLNSFITFGLDTPITVQDTIYVGWTQTDENNLAVGYDRNSTLGFNKKYIYTNNIWSKSNVIIEGSPMIRLILDGKRNYRSANSGSSQIESVRAANSFSIFPNPSSDIINIETDFRGESTYIIYDLVGKEVSKGTFKTTTKVSVETIESGLYILALYQDNVQVSSSKILISH